MDHAIGHYSFIIGVALAVILGIFSAFTDQTQSWMILTLFILGLIVGILNISAKEITPFLVASIALLLAGSANVLILNTLVNPLGTIISAILTNIKIFVAPAAIVVSLKAVKQLAES